MVKQNGVVVVIAVGLLGCVELDHGAVESEVVCDFWTCGTNSPFVDGRRFHDFHLDGAVNYAGFQFTGFRKGRTRYTLAVKDGRLRGEHEERPQLTGADLVGAQIRLFNVDLVRSYTITITGVGSATYAASRGGPPLTYETYVFQWVRVGDTQTPPQNLCSQASPNLTDTLGMRGDDTLVFEGERIPKDRTSIDEIDRRWVNFGCAGHALSKLALTGHVEAASGVGFETTIPEREAMLKMLVADYCNDGRRTTVHGEPLVWADHRGWMTMPEVVAPAAHKLEARWSNTGAVCLDVPRLINTTSTDYPDVEATIASRCSRPPTCADMDPTHFSGYHLVSANPP
jgi:hypothetical protein